MENFTVFIANHMGLFYTLAIIMITLMIVEMLRAKRGQARIAPTQAVTMINKQNAVIIDIRNHDSFQKGHIVDSLNLPARELNTASKKLDKYKNKPVIIVCGSGMDSQKAAAELAKQGYNAFILAGGLRAWSEAELPLVKKE
jgi:rhodanese-related sulfurtransferase